MLEKIITILVGYLGILPNIISIAILVFLSILVSHIIEKIVKFFLPKTLDPILIAFIPRAIKFFTFILGIILSMGASGLSTTSITAAFGISTLAIGMALKDLFINMFKEF